MKKYLIIIILLSFFRVNVYADTYYGNYYYLGLEDVLINDEIKKEEVKLYNTYSLNKVDLGYIEDDIGYIKDINDYILIDEYSEFNDEDNHELISIGSDNKKINKIRINSLVFSTSFKEVKIYNKEEEIKYKVSGRDIKDLKHINDNNLDTYLELVYDFSYIEFDLLKDYNLHDISVEFYNKEGLNNFKFNLVINNDKYLVKFNMSDFHKIKFIEGSEIKKQYFGKKKLYRHYKEEKKVDNIYVLDGDNIILDDYKIINKYYKRDKLVLSSNNIINNKDKSLNDFIEYSSGLVEVKCDINYDINGKYDCLYKLNDIEVNKVIEVNNINEDGKNLVHSTNLNNKVNNDKKEQEEIECDVIVKEEIESNQVVKDKNKLLFLFKYFIFIFFIALEIILYRRKRKRSIVE